MDYQIDQFEKFVRLVEQHSPEEGINLSSSVQGFGTFRLSSPEERKPIIDAVALFIVAQGKKNCYVGFIDPERNTISVKVLF